LLEIREKLLFNLILINVIVLVASGTLGYYLAGKTLEPIEEMIIKQKRFISDAAHELKTPLTAIKTDIEVTLRDKKLTLEDSRKTLTRTIDEINELSLLTSNLLASSKYNNSDIYKKEVEVFELGGLIDKVVRKLNVKAKEKNIKIIKDLKPIEIRADPHEIEHVIMNILDNAIKYSNTDSEVSVSSSSLANKAEVKIVDHGMGIPEKNLNLIFEPFFRGDKSRDKFKTEGYGLGLAITKDIIESYGGTISISSKPGKGSTFTISFAL
jgi:signal transduction histidine kinase